jgi:hypothetical protein
MGSVVSTPLCLRVLTPAETLLDVPEVAWVQVQLADGGGIGIWPGHGPLLAETRTAPLRYADQAGEHIQELEAGILEISRDGVTIFTSGLAGSGGPGPLSDQDEGMVRFDRLIQALFAALKGHPGGMAHEEGKG